MSYYDKIETPIGTFTEQELDDMPDLSEGHTADLKVDEDGFRIWYSRMSAADYMGAPLPPSFPVEFETLVNGGWKECDAAGNLI